MGLENRIDALKDRHHELDIAIELETTRICPDDVEIHTLKKEKLRIKDELSAIA
ncbi:MAG: YdcH family protein [Magnetovibrio sp.]|nr:YdcH family protein [Magnetovibrio sp.]